MLARILTRPRSMRSRVYETVERPSVRPSICPIDRLQQRRATGLLLSARRAGDIDRLLHNTPQQQMRAVSC